MSSPIWMITTSPAIGGALGLVEGDVEVTVLVVGDQATVDALTEAGVTALVHVPTSDTVPPEALAAQVGQLVAEASPSVVVAPARGPERALLAAAATALDAPVLPAVTSLRVDEYTVSLVRGLYGGLVAATETYSGPIAVLVDGGVAPAPTGTAVPVRQVAPSPAGLTIVSTSASQQASVDLGSATRVVAVGRGLKAREDVELIEKLAAAAGAQVGCSRPLAEGQDWFAKDQYVGISGQHIAPDLYLAIGISGQLQHMAGVRGATTIVAINADEKAPVFTECDYGLVGDLYDIVPALT
ncbi:MAG: electron transfer flavoprotein subunit alpha/FixB family protein, partial [Cellulomonas sp.]|nr:electron transfer flavoprotein subunit alpha/FixB family protein [Cellulomonas sp.]